MARFTCLAILVVLMGAVGCGSEDSPTPTVNVQATVDAAVQATVESVDSVATAAPTVKPTATPTPTSTPPPMATPTSTPAPTATATPTPTATAAPTPTLEPLMTTDTQWHMMVRLSATQQFGQLWWEEHVLSLFPIDPFGLTVSINGVEFCNPSPLFSRRLGELGCSSYEGGGDPQVYAFLETNPPILFDCILREKEPLQLIYACRNDELAYLGME